MKMYLRKRYTFLAFALTVVGGLALACFLWLRVEERQYALNRALIMAIEENSTGQVRALLATGADANVQEKELPSPTWYGLFKHLLFHAPLPANKSNTALMIACKNMNLEQVDALLMSGADINATNRYGETALMVASVSGASEIIPVLLERRAGIDVQDHVGNTALHWAVLARRYGSIEMLLKHHANRHLKNSQGLTPLAVDESKHSPDLKIFRLLKQAGATE